MNLIGQRMFASSMQYSTVRSQDPNAGPIRAQMLKQRSVEITSAPRRFGPNVAQYSDAPQSPENDRVGRLDSPIVEILGERLQYNVVQPRSRRSLWREY